MCIRDSDGTVCDFNSRFGYPSNEIGSLITTLLRNNIAIGVATGRGRSVKEALQKIIPSKWQSRVYVGYYNGGAIGSLSDDFAPNNNKTIDETLAKFMSHLDYKTMPAGCTVERRPKQISIQMNNHVSSDLAHILCMLSLIHISEPTRPY